MKYSANRKPNSFAKAVAKDNDDILALSVINLLIPVVLVVIVLLIKSG